MLFDPTQINLYRPIALVSASRNLNLSDRGRHLYSNGAAVTLTIPANTFAAGDEIEISQIGSGTVTIAVSGVTLNGSSNSANLSQYAGIVLKFFAPNAAIAFGVATGGGGGGGVTFPIALTQGGTGADNAADARTNLGAIATTDSRLSDERTPTDGSVTNAKVSPTAAIEISKLSGVAASGNNSDITTLNGLTTPLSIAQGGTGADSAAAARTNLGAIAIAEKGIANGVCPLGADQKVPAQNLPAIGGVVNVVTNPLLFNDFLLITANNLQPFQFSASGGGSLNAPNAGVINRDHPGIVRIRSTTTANSGARIMTQEAMLLIGGGEVFTAILQFSSNASIATRFGFVDTTGATDATDGLYFECGGSGTINCVAKTANNGTRTASASLLSAAINTWYKFVITVNAAATSANFSIFNAIGDLIASTNITTNIPTAPGRETGVGGQFQNANAVAYDLVHLDYMGWGYSTALVR